MKTLTTILFAIALTLTLRAGDIVIYPNGFQTNSPPYYAVYARTVSQGWGWAPDTNGNTVFTATYTNNLLVTNQYLGKNGDTATIPTNSITIPNVPFSPKYRFTVYYPTLASVPHSTNDAPLLLHNFKTP